MFQMNLFESEPIMQHKEPRVRLASYDWIVINSSAGKDSQAMLDFVCKSAEAAGVLDRVVVVHCDLAEEEWEGTRELAEEQARHYGVRFEVVKRPQGGILQHTLDRAESLARKRKEGTPPVPSSTERWCTSDHKRGPVSTLLTRLTDEQIREWLKTPPVPSSTNRWCTSHHKTDQVNKLITRLTNEKKGVRRVRILNCLGMRHDESRAREKLLPFKLDKRNTNGKRISHIWLPIYRWTKEEVWSRVMASGVRHHYAYDLGMPRLSCCFCIFAPREALMLAGKHNRELLDRYIEVEQKVGFTFRKGLPLIEIREALERGEEPGEVRTWEM